MKKKYRVFKDIDGEMSKPQEVNFVYEIGEIVSVDTHTNQYRCVEIIQTEGRITYLFKQGKLVYTFDW